MGENLQNTLTAIANAGEGFQSIAVKEMPRHHPVFDLVDGVALDSERCGDVVRLLSNVFISTSSIYISSLPQENAGATTSPMRR